jgi:hypothetical protein
MVSDLRIITNQSALLHAKSVGRTLARPGGPRAALVSASEPAFTRQLDAGGRLWHGLAQQGLMNKGSREVGR